EGGGDPEGRQHRRAVNRHGTAPDGEDAGDDGHRGGGVQARVEGRQDGSGHQRRAPQSGRWGALLLPRTPPRVRPPPAFTLLQRSAAASIFFSSAVLCATPRRSGMSTNTRRAPITAGVSAM